MTYHLQVSDLAAKTLADLAKQGLVVGTSTDMSTPRLPENITDIDDESLMELFANLTAYLDFISFQVSLAQIDERDAERKLDQAVAMVTANQPKALAAVIKAAALSDPSVVRLSDDHSIKYNYRKIIETMANNLERDIYLVSRELTRRTSGGGPMVRARKFNT
jgi:hypothetical protein